MPSQKVKLAIRAFEKAVRDKANAWTYGDGSPDPEEAAELDAIHFAIEHNYVKARAKLERLMENL